MEKQGINRNIIEHNEKFYTNKKIAEMCVILFEKFISPQSNDLIIEPSSGNGSFINGIKKINSYSLFLDIRPEHHEIQKQDFLIFDTNSEYLKIHDKIHIIGNPPFGKNSSLARKFVKKSCQFTNSISFILPKSFRKQSFQKSFDTHFHLIFEIDLPSFSFLIDNVSVDVPTIFQIWLKKSTKRIILINETPFGNIYQFVKQNENPDVSIRRVGINSGKMEKNTSDKSIQSHYFIKFTTKFKEKVPIDFFIKYYSNNFSYNFNNTVGAKSISKMEYLVILNSIIQKMILQYRKSH
jgi:hypothetical protein